MMIPFPYEKEKPNQTKVILKKLRKSFFFIGLPFLRKIWSKLQLGIEL